MFKLETVAAAPEADALKVQGTLNQYANEGLVFNPLERRQLSRADRIRAAQCNGEVAKPKSLEVSFERIEIHLAAEGQHDPQRFIVHH